MKKIAPAERFTINHLASAMLEASNNGDSKLYNCYSEALKAFLVNLIGSDLYLACDKGRGFDLGSNGKNYVLDIESRMEEVIAERRREEASRREDSVVDVLIEGYHTVGQIAHKTAISDSEVESIIDGLLGVYELTVNKNTVGERVYKIIN